MDTHPRTQKVRLARLDIERAVLEISEREGLTFVETVQALADTLQLLGKHALRSERHPRNPNKGADEA